MTTEHLHHVPDALNDLLAGIKELYPCAVLTLVIRDDPSLGNVIVTDDKPDIAAQTLLDAVASDRKVKLAEERPAAAEKAREDLDALIGMAGMFNSAARVQRVARSALYYLGVHNPAPALLDEPDLGPKRYDISEA